MAEISAGLVKELRELTGLGMMECKKALAECEGDLKKAEELLRIKSGAKASKAASRIAAEGVIGAWLAADRLRRQERRLRGIRSLARRARGDAQPGGSGRTRRPG
jgi:hypothetical protein